MLLTKKNMVVVKLLDEKLVTQDVDKKDMNVLKKLFSNKKIKAIQILEVFRKIFKTDNVQFVEKNSFVYKVVLNRDDKINDYFILILDKESLYTYYLNKQNELIFFEYLGVPKIAVNDNINYKTFESK